MPHAPANDTRLRAAHDHDVTSIVAIWEAGWREAHLGRVPDELLAHRTPAALIDAARAHLDHTIVAERHDAVTGCVITGFVITVEDQIAHLYVDRSARRQGLAGRLLDAALNALPQPYERAWLAVVEDNASARHCYERAGWHDDGSFDDPVPTPTGVVIVRARRYVRARRTSSPTAPRTGGSSLNDMHSVTDSHSVTTAGS